MAKKEHQGTGFGWFPGCSFQFTRAIRKTALSALSAASQLILLRLQDTMLMEMALPTYIHAGRFSCEHEICPQECTSELAR